MLSADPGLPYLLTIRRLICFLKCPHHPLLNWNLPFSSIPDSHVVVVCLLPHHRTTDNPSYASSSSH